MRGTLIALVAAACVPTTTPSSGTPSPGGTSLTTPAATAVPLVEDRFVQVLRPQVDLLYVVQDTDGTADAQDALVENVPYTLDYFLGSGIDYHIGVVTTDADDPSESGQLLEAGGVRWIDDGTPNPLGVFAALVGQAGASGTQAVQPRGAIWQAIEVHGTGANAGFFREDSLLSVAVVGDGTDATDPAIVDAATFEAWFPALRADPADARFTCLLTSGVPLSDCADVAAAVGGQVLDASVDPATAAELLGLGATGLQQAWPLSQLPVPGSIEVEVEDVSGATIRFSTDDWTWDPSANTVTFVEYVPSALATIVVRYEPAP